MVRATRQAGLHRLFRVGIASSSHTAEQFHRKEHNNIMRNQTADTSGEAKFFSKSTCLQLSCRSCISACTHFTQFPTFIHIHSISSTSFTLSNPTLTSTEVRVPSGSGQDPCLCATQGKTGTNYSTLRPPLKLFFTGSGKLPWTGLLCPIVGMEASGTQQLLRWHPCASQSGCFCLHTLQATSLSIFLCFLILSF